MKALKKFAKIVSILARIWQDLIELWEVVTDTEDDDSDDDDKDEDKENEQS